MTLDIDDEPVTGTPTTPPEPPTPGAGGPGPHTRVRAALTRIGGVLRTRQTPPATPSADRRAPAPRRTRLTVPAPRQHAPRDGRWWAGAALLLVSALLVGFVAHVATLSVFQHHRAQTLAYGNLRTSLAKAETPVGQLDLTEQMVTPGTPVALLQIPSIGLSEVLVEGTTATTLRSGPGHRRDSVMPGQAGTAVVLGRQVTYGGPFGDLTHLAPGDRIDITTGQGTSTYLVLGLRRAGDPMPEELPAGQGRLELMTADGLALFPSGVLHVDAELVTDPVENPSRVLGYAALPTAERAMGQDTPGWFTVAFVLVLFAAAAVGLWWLWTTWGRWHAWLIGLPVLLALGVTCADLAMNALPNLL